MKIIIYFLAILNPNSLGVNKEHDVCQQEELHVAGEAPTPIGAHFAVIEEVLDEE